MLFKELEASFSKGWTQKLSQPFNCLAVDSIFKYPGLSLAVAGEDGKVYIYQISSLEVNKSSTSTAHSNHLKLLSEHETKGDALQVSGRYLSSVLHRNLVRNYYYSLVILIMRKCLIEFCCMFAIVFCRQWLSMM